MTSLQGTLRRLRRVPEMIPLHVIVLDLANAFRSQGFPGEVLTGAPAAGGLRQMDTAPAASALSQRRLSRLIPHAISCREIHRQGPVLKQWQK
jgi:hypothetical protein